MSRNPRFDCLFEPVSIGPLKSPNRFYQTPHATGMGMQRLNANRALREMKAEGGWGVVCTEYCSIHPTSDDSPYGYLTLWDDEDTRRLAGISAAIHKHDSLAGIELWHGGSHANNRETRLPMLAPDDGSAKYLQPGQVRRMNKRDIGELRSWHRDAVKRALDAEFDIVYVYAGHEYLPFQFLSPRFNHRCDEYGGSLENRVRLLRELIEETLELVHGRNAAVAVRLAVDELQGTSGICSEGEGREVVEMLADLPDLWDLALGGGLGNDSCSSRFSDEGFQQPYVEFVKQVTDKPVVSVGRYTSPDAMVSRIKNGWQDFVGAARPSIADPFLPWKIDQGREDEIRECIGCNICRAANNEGVSLRCTQNPTMGQEWTRRWHPEKVPVKHRDASVLVVGSGPAGLEAALILAKRDYHVILAESNDRLGGRINHEAGLPGLANWRRVRDYRETLLRRMANVEIYLNSELDAEHVTGFNAELTLLATGSRWRRDGIGASLHQRVTIDPENVLTPDDLFEGVQPRHQVVIFDDDQYFMAGALAEQLVEKGHSVRLVTPGAVVSAWTAMTDEQDFIQRRMLGLGIKISFQEQLQSVEKNRLLTHCIYSGEVKSHDFESLVLVTGRHPINHLENKLRAEDCPLEIQAIGDAQVPSSIADAVFRGHKAAREYGLAKHQITVRRERVEIET